jgi:hypothetical protein
MLKPRLLYNNLGMDLHNDVIKNLEA